MKIFEIISLKLLKAFVVHIHNLCYTFTQPANQMQLTETVSK